VNCIPPWHLSSLGPVEYLHELLKASANSTAITPLRPDPATLGTLVAGRRGPLGLRMPPRQNLHTPVPLIDSGE